MERWKLREVASAEMRKGKIGAIVGRSRLIVLPKGGEDNIGVRSIERRGFLEKHETRYDTNDNQCMWMTKQQPSSCAHPIQRAARYC